MFIVDAFPQSLVGCLLEIVDVVLGCLLQIVADVEAPSYELKNSGNLKLHL